MHQLHARRTRLFSSDYWIQEGTRNLTLLDLARLRSRGEFLLDGASYEFRAEGLLGGSYVLERDGRVVARATRAQLFPLVYRVHAGDRILELHSHPPGRKFSLRHGDRVTGAIRPAGPFSRSGVAEFQEALAPAVEVFLIALVLLKWRRRARGSGAASG